MVASVSRETPRFRTVATGCTYALPTRISLVGIWCCRSKAWSGWIPQCFCLVIVQKGTISSHPRSNSVQARHSEVKNLDIIRVCVKHQSVIFHQLQYVSEILDKQDRPKDRPLRHANDGVDLDAAVWTYWLRPLVDEWRLRIPTCVKAKGGTTLCTNCDCVTEHFLNSIKLLYKIF